MVAGEVGRRGRCADADVRQKGILGGILHGLHVNILFHVVYTDACIYVLLRAYIVGREDGRLKELDVESGDDDALECLTDSRVAEQLLHDRVQVLAVVLGSHHALEQAQRSFAAQQIVYSS